MRVCSAIHSSNCVFGPGIFGAHLFEAAHKLSNTRNKIGVDTFIQVLFFVADKPRVV